MLQKTNIPGYSKDTKSSFVINTNDHELQNIKNLQKKNKELTIIKREVVLMRQDLEKLKELVYGTSQSNTP